MVAPGARRRRGRDQQAEGDCDTGTQVMGHDTEGVERVCQRKIFRSLAHVFMRFIGVVDSEKAIM